MAGIEGDRDRYYREALQPAKLRGYVELPSPTDVERAILV